jgi:DNA-binding LacI/PurR family transcriptional regulator
VLSGTPPEAIVHKCLDSGQKLILINRDEHLPGPHHIGLDGIAAARTALAAFREAGCRRLAVVTSEAGTASLIAREQAFRQLASEAGFEVMVSRRGSTSYESGVEGARLLFSGPEPPDAAFCVTDLIALGLMDAARHEFGREIPDQLSVIGFDDIEPAGWASYRLTTFAPPLDRLAARVVSLVTAERGETAQLGRTTLEAEFVRRNSVRPSRR